MTSHKCPKSAASAIKLKRSIARNAIPILVTGMAGTGKSRLLEHGKRAAKQSGKTFIVLAPTGVAAHQVGGVTFHSFTRMDPFLDLTDPDFNPVKFKNEEILGLRIDVVFIDEIGMMTGFQLDYLSDCMKHLNQSLKPFGGAKVVMFGDYMQLGPIISQDQIKLMELRSYNSPYSYDAKAFQTPILHHLELKQVHRQVDPEFIRNLKRIRKGHKTGKAINYFNRSCSRPIRSKESFVALCFDNKTVTKRNDMQLKNHSADTGEPIRAFRAEVKGNFPVGHQIVPPTLKLARGVRVMARRNVKSKSFFNGSLGTVVDLKKGQVSVKFDDNDDTVMVTPVTWKKYEIRQKSGSPEKVEVASFRQIPLQLGYAFTIHKAQGLTLSKIIIDLPESSFAEGQLYTALSRTRRIGDIRLIGDLSPRHVKVDGMHLEAIQKLPKL